MSRIPMLPDLIIEPLKIGLAAVLRMYGFEGLLRQLHPAADVDERIAKLNQVQNDLEAAIDAVKVLRQNADNSKQEAEQLRLTVTDFRKIRKQRKNSLSYPKKRLHDYFSRLTQKAVVAAYSRA